MRIGRGGPCQLTPRERALPSGATACRDRFALTPTPLPGGEGLRFAQGREDVHAGGRGPSGLTDAKNCRAWACGSGLALEHRAPVVLAPWACKKSDSERRHVSHSVALTPNPSPEGEGLRFAQGYASVVLGRKDEHPEGDAPHPLWRTSQVTEAAAATDAPPGRNVRGRPRPGCTVRVGSSALAPRIHCILRPDVRLSAGSRTR